MLDEEPEHFGLGERAKALHQADAMMVGSISTRACLEQRCALSFVITYHRTDEHRVTVVIDLVWVRLCLEQHSKALDFVRPRVTGGQHQRRAAFAIGLLHIRLRLNEQLEQRRVRLLARPVHRVRATVVLMADGGCGARLEQQRRRLGRSLLRDKTECALAIARIDGVDVDLVLDEDAHALKLDILPVFFVSKCKHERRAAFAILILDVGLGLAEQLEDLGVGVLARPVHRMRAYPIHLIDRLCRAVLQQQLDALNRSAMRRGIEQRGTVVSCIISVGLGAEQ